MTKDGNFLIFLSGEDYGEYKLHYQKIYSNNVLVRDYMPCYRKSDNTIGMYDMVNGVFYGNDGTGTFTKGEDI